MRLSLFYTATLAVVAVVTSIASANPTQYADPSLVLDKREAIEAIPVIESELKSLNVTSWHSKYHPLDEIKLFYKFLAAFNPHLVRFIPSIGKTIEGRDIFAVEISSPSRLRPDGTPKKTAYHEFNMHAREWLTSAVGQYYAEYLVKAYRSKDARVTAILDNMVIALVPVVNPDGYVHTWTADRMWRKNRRNNGNGTFGVDLNRNFPIFWGKEGASDDPASDNFHGAHPASEPETRAIMKYYSSLKNRITALEVHTCAQFIGYPFGGAAQLPPQPALNNFKTIATKMANTVAKGGGKEYSVVNLYNDVIPFTGLSIDYFYKPDNSTRAVYSLGFEFRRGDIGDPESAIGCFIYENSDIVKVGKEVIPAFLDLVDFGLANPLA